MSAQDQRPQRVDHSLPLSASTSITLAHREGYLISEPRCRIFAEKTSQDRFDATPTPVGPFEAVTASRCIWDGGLGVVAGDFSPPLGLCAPQAEKRSQSGATNSRSKRADRFRSIAAGGWDTATFAGYWPILPK